MQAVGVSLRRKSGFKFLNDAHRPEEQWKTAWQLTCHSAIQTVCVQRDNVVTCTTRRSSC